jgi:hypothetical protein
MEQLLRALDLSQRRHNHCSAHAKFLTFSPFSPTHEHSHRRRVHSAVRQVQGQEVNPPQDTPLWTHPRLGALQRQWRPAQAGRPGLRHRDVHLGAQRTIPLVLFRLCCLSLVLRLFYSRQTSSPFMTSAPPPPPPHTHAHTLNSHAHTHTHIPQVDLKGVALPAELDDAFFARPDAAGKDGEFFDKKEEVCCSQLATTLPRSCLLTPPLHVIYTSPSTTAGQ